MDFLQNTRYSLAVVADFNAKYDRLSLTPTAPTTNLRTNNRIAGW
jgi:hypothetical protein